MPNNYFGNLGFEGLNFMSYFGVLAAGLIATTAMLFVLDVIHLSGIAKPEPIHTIGGLITGDTENSFWTGLSLHFVTGTLFSLLYFGLFKLLPVHSVFSFGATGLMVGMMHGLIVGFLVLISVAEHHRDARMRATGIGVVFSYVIAHCAYGLVLGGAMGELFVSNTATLDMVGAVTTGTVIFGFNFLVVAIAVYAFWRERLEERAIALSSRGMLDNEESTYRAGHVFPQKVRVMPGGDSDPYGSPSEREPRSAPKAA